MLSEPLPDDGWSRQILNLRNALISTAEEHGQAPGIWSGGDIAEAVTWRDGIRLTGAVEHAPVPVHKLAGTHMWGGIFFGHFGHFLVETISRLWAARQLGIDSVLFTPRHAKLQDFVSYQKDLIRLILPDAQITIVREPTEVEELFIPGQGFGLGKISRGTPEFRSMIRDAMAKIEPGKADKVYISRTKFGGKGGIIGERWLEKSFQAEGYVPVYPEKLSLEEQFAIFKGARQIVGLDSSAFHVLGYVADREQDIGIILRRNHPAYKHIADHITAFTGREPCVIDAVIADWMPEKQRMPNHVSWGELDHAKVLNVLMVQGFIKNADSWMWPNEKRLAEARAWSEQKSREPLVRRSIDETSRLKLRHPAPANTGTGPAIKTAHL